MNLELDSKGKIISPVPDWARFLIVAFLLALPIALWVAWQFVNLTIILGVAFLLFVALIGFISFKTALSLLVVFLPLEPLVVKFIPADFALYFRLVPEVIILSLFIVGFTKFLRNKNLPRVNNPIVLPLFIFAGICVLSILVNRVDPLIAGVGLRQLFRFFALSLAVYFYGFTRKDILKLVTLVAVIAFFESALGLVQAVLGAQIDALLQTGKDLYIGRFQVAREFFQNRSPGERVFATMGRYDQLGTFLSLVAAVSLGFIYEAKEKVKKYSLLLLIVILPTLLLTYSRASWFGFILGLILVAIFIKKDKKVLAILLILITAVVSYVGIREIEVRKLTDEAEVSPINRLLEAFSAKRLRGEYTAKGRLYFLIETPPAILQDSPVLGVGPGQFGGGATTLTHNTEAYDKLNLPFGVYGVEGTIDNNWMSIFAETGILGLLAYIFIFVAVLRFARKAYRDPDSDWLARSFSLGLMAATMGFILQGFLGTYFEVRTLAPYYWLTFALAVLSYSQAKYKNENTSS